MNTMLLIIVSLIYTFVISALGFKFGLYIAEIGIKELVNQGKIIVKDEVKK